MKNEMKWNLTFQSFHIVYVRSHTRACLTRQFASQNVYVLARAIACYKFYFTYLIVYLFTTLYKACYAVQKSHDLFDTDQNRTDSWRLGLCFEQQWIVFYIWNLDTNTCKLSLDDSAEFCPVVRSVWLFCPDTGFLNESEICATYRQLCGLFHDSEIVEP